MSASASLRTGKNRRALRALIAAPLLALGTAVGPATAHVTPSYVFTPAQVHLADGHCSISGWPHGELYCNTSLGANFPNGTQEIFGIGLDGAMWTDWGTAAHPSGWKSLGAPPNTTCSPDWANHPMSISNADSYAVGLTCWGMDNRAWNKDRSDGVNGGWGPWYL